MGDTIRTHDGIHRKLGLLLPPTGFVSAMPVFADGAEWTDSEIREAISDPQRRLGRRLFGRNYTHDQGSVGSCFPPGTLIRMGDGTQKPIESVQLLDSVLTAEGRVRRVVKTMARPHVGAVKRVCLWGNRHLRCTAEHPILTQNGYKTAESLVKSDWVAIPRFMPKTVESIVPSEYVSIKSKTSKKKTFAHEAYSYSCQIPGKSAATVEATSLPELILLNESFGWLCGIYLAEGSLSHGKVTFSFHENEIETLAKRVVDIFMDEFGVKANIVAGRGGKRVCDVKVYGTGWVKLFESLMGTGSAVKTIHGHLASGPIGFLEAMLQGWTDGDGLGDKDRCGGVTVSHGLAMNMFDIANSLGHRPTVESGDFKINPKHKIKHRHKRYIVAWPSNANSNTLVPRVKLEENVAWRKVHKVEDEPYSGFVFNLEVEDDHSYVAESIGVHNCNGWAAAGCYARARYLRGYADQKQFSGSWVYSLCNGGYDNGSALEDSLAVGQQVGFAEASLVLPHEIYPQLQPQREAAKKSAAKHRSFQAFKLPTKQALRTALARGFPCVVAVSAGQAFMSLRNGISGVDRGSGNHAVLCDDIAIVNGQECYDMQNSWGIGFGDMGRSWLTWQHFEETFRFHTFYAVASTEEG